METSFDQLIDRFPNSRRVLGSSTWERILSALEDNQPKTLLEHLNSSAENLGIPPYLADLALLESNHFLISNSDQKLAQPVDNLSINPNLILVPVQWKHLPELINNENSDTHEPVQEECIILIWKVPFNGQIHCREAVDDDLLALKLVAENITPKDAAVQGKTTLAKIQAVLLQAVSKGILIPPDSLITRDTSLFVAGKADNSFLKSEVFTLQWHITQACDLHCRHCYDRTDRTRLSVSDALTVLDDLYDFTTARHVRGHVTFTGGNPLLYPDFKSLYQGAADRGFSIAILGNPTKAEIIDELLDIQPLTHFQISLEGLEPYNDYIRGPGHFKKSLEFLDLLKAKDVYSMVMLTLNKDNMDQVLPLAEKLRDRTDSLTFNRLAMVGEGRNLELPNPSDFHTFLRAYEASMVSNPILSLKDNLFNIVKHENSSELFGGCTGHGCGAAFNFISLLPDGEVHACRKFPSRIGTIKTSSLQEIYDSNPARLYRAGSAACRGCDLSAVCRGCPAVVHGMGLDSFVTRDPFCFYGCAPDNL